MSSRNVIKSDLQKLLPSYEESQLPPELIVMAEMFVTQAQQLFLNDSEKPAKSFLCAHIACEQLSAKLSLPELNTKAAPVPPAKYKALFKRIRSEATFKQVRDSGRSQVDTRRRIARDHAKEVCSKLEMVPIAMVLDVLDHLTPSYKQSDTRALVAAVYLLCLQSLKKSKVISIRTQSALLKDLGLQRPEVEQALEYVRQKSHGKDWFDLTTVKKLDLLQEPAKKKARITQVRMMHPAIDFESVRYKNEYRVWKENAIKRLEGLIKELEDKRDEASTVVGHDV